MTEKVANQLEQIYNKVKKQKSDPTRSHPDLGWNTEQQGKNRQTLPKEKQQRCCNPNYTYPVEGPPSSRL